MFYLAGLGNPGAQYDGTRHNIGFAIIDALYARGELSDWRMDARANALVAEGVLAAHEVMLLKPQTFMNRSGGAVARYITRPDDAASLIVVHDDIDLALGTIRVAFDRGAGGHNGVTSIIRSLGTTAFVRVRVGVALTDESGAVVKYRGEHAVEKFVLGTFSHDEQLQIDAIVARAADACVSILTNGHVQAMNEVNGR
jgi:peptidyl-tRNA hydrolase, PTH1 family